MQIKAHWPVGRRATALLVVAALLLTGAAGMRLAGLWPTAPSAEGNAPPLVAASDAASHAASVNILDRAAVAAFYQERYLGGPGVDSGWTGSHAACDEGTTTPEFRAVVLQRVNYFRAMAGVPAGVQFSDELNRKAQKAALMLSANGKLTHHPDLDWLCYSPDGAWAAEKSNLFLGVCSVEAVDGYMEDRGTTNYFVPHRRWLLHPLTQWMGSGDIPATDGYPAANALWVVGSSPEAASLRDPYVAWPPPGFVPYSLVFPRWSVSRDGADLTQASVTMLHHGQRVPLTLLEPVRGQGLNTLVWEPHIPPRQRPGVDTWYTVQIENALIDGWPAHFRYTVVIFSPEG